MRHKIKPCTSSSTEVILICNCFWGIVKAQSCKTQLSISLNFRTMIHIVDILGVNLPKVGFHCYET